VRTTRKINQPATEWRKTIATSPDVGNDAQDPPASHGVEKDSGLRLIFKWVHDEWRARRDFAWQIGYGAFSVSQSSVSAVSKYIANQEEHHRRLSFQKEFIAYLKKHKIDYDERYIWE
jgi:hypothetical protein